MKRFAIYFAPPEDASLTRLGAAWLGRDVFRDDVAHLPEPALNGFSREVWRIATESPRLYGFHATLKPPFRLKDPADEPELYLRLREFASTQRAFEAPALKVSAIASFLALTLSEPCPAFEALAAACVREFDCFRAQPSEEELARRRGPHLNVRHLEYLEQWGYPYVLDEWRFHMTLTSSLEIPLLEAAGAHLRTLFSAHCQQPLPVDSICLFEQPGQGEPFRAVERFPLS